MPSLNRSYALAALAALSGIGALVATYLFVRNMQEPPPGSDGFAYGLAGFGALLYALLGLVVVGVGATMAGLEAFDAGSAHQRLVGQVGTGLTTVGPPLVVVWAHFEAPVELTGVAVVCVALGALLVAVVCGWVGVTAVIRASRRETTG